MQHVCMKNNADEVLCSYERLNFFRRGAFSPKKTTTVFLALKTPPRCTKTDQIPKSQTMKIPLTRKSPLAPFGVCIGRKVEVVEKRGKTCPTKGPLPNESQGWKGRPRARGLPGTRTDRRDVDLASIFDWTPVCA